MKSHRRLISTENPVNFLKIIFSDDTPSTGIRLPEKFTEEYGKDLSQRVTLKVPNGDVWQVDLQKSKDEFWLKNGWEKFADRYNLGFADLLMFKYEGFSTFGVIIFNASASEIQYPKNIDRATAANSVKQSSWSEDKKHVIKINDEGECLRKSQKMKRKEERRRALEKAKANFKNEGPFFMFLPVAFRRMLLRGHKSRGHKSRRQCMLLLEEDGNMKTYMVFAQNGQLGNADWQMFVKDNGIKVGDICVFELFRKDKSVFGVTIMRYGF
ncbi:hypothetical protein E3N88_02555 [Mikania micrantha]|uniref:TF-B3 domain-containing protein n=1 Tax=Mikania micrantha TaxID=192012 RepID=A0A5N6Q4A5_9ASTR|nr:hypothetical protein E3N88_02555 [Mikania micrantha]